MANFAIPGDASFPLNAMYDKPKDRNDLDTMRSYFQQLRQEIAVRLVEKIYSASYTDTEGGKRPSKWWVCFAKRKFMNLQL
jgi:actin related protein 2/3 complex subunit 3